MSLGAIDFGILVDGAVIIVENMIFYLHQKEFFGLKIPLKQRNEIAYHSATKMMNSAFFGQIIILIVFIPILALQGSGRKNVQTDGHDFRICRVGRGFALPYLHSDDGFAGVATPKTDEKTWGEKVVGKFEKYMNLPLLGHCSATDWLSA